MGILLILCGIYFISAPLLTLVTLIIILGIALLIAGVFEVVLYIRHRGTQDTHITTLVLGIIDIIIALLIFFQPLVMAPVFPWIVGAGIAIFGISEVLGAFRLRKKGISAWGWMVFAGIASLLFGILIFANPLLLPIFIGCFVVISGLTMTINGFLGN